VINWRMMHASLINNLDLMFFWIAYSPEYSMVFFFNRSLTSIQLMIFINHGLEDMVRFFEVIQYKNRYYLKIWIINQNKFKVFYDFFSVPEALLPSGLIAVPLCASILDGPTANSSNGREYIRIADSLFERGKKFDWIARKQERLRWLSIKRNIFYKNLQTEKKIFCFSNVENVCLIDLINTKTKKINQRGKTKKWSSWLVSLEEKKSIAEFD